MVSKTLYSSNSDEWGTPQDLFDKLDEEFIFTFDPCANPNRLLKKQIMYYHIEDSGLNASWFGSVFVNPPYSNIKEWCKKCYEERNNCEVIVLLIPSRTDTRYFHDYIYNIAELRFIKGRLKFINNSFNKVNEKTHSAPFPSVLCIFRPDNKRSGSDGI